MRGWKDRLGVFIEQIRFFGVIFMTVFNEKDGIPAIRVQQKGQCDHLISRRNHLFKRFYILSLIFRFNSKGECFR